MSVEVTYDELRRVSELLIETANSRDAEPWDERVKGDAEKIWALRYIADYLDDLYLAAVR